MAVQISAADVKQLREKTGAGMMDCKSALVEAEGDMAVAERKLKERGVAAAAKRTGRATSEGRVFAQVGETGAALVELSSETDFVARNAEFVQLGDSVVQQVVDGQISEPTPELTVQVADAIGRIKENIELRRIRLLQRAGGDHISSYIHGEGGIGVLVKLTAGDAAGHDAVATLGFDLALHVAAYAPAYLSSDDVDPAYLAEQEGIFRTQAEALGKPEKVVEGIVKGKLKKHLQEICLVEQDFVKDSSRTVKQVLADTGKEAGGEITLAEYAYFRVGDESGDTAADDDAAAPSGDAA